MRSESSRRSGPPRGLLWSILSHKVAANVWMLVAVLVGLYGVWMIPTTLLPEFTIPVVTVRTVWPGASSQDAESSIIKPIETALQSLSDVETIQSYAVSQLAFVIVRFDIKASLDKAYQDVKRQVEQVLLPQSAETPIVQTVEVYDPVTTLLLAGKTDDQELRVVAEALQDSLQDTGAKRVQLQGLREDKIAVRFSKSSLYQYHLKPDDIVSMIRLPFAASSAGYVGKDDKLVYLTTPRFADSAWQLGSLPLVLPDKSTVRLQDVAQVKRVSDDQSMRMEKEGQPVVGIQVLRPMAADSLSLGRLVRQWLEQAQARSNGWNVSMLDEAWTIVTSRMSLLMSNALTGLFLVMAILMIALGWRLSFWVVLGIPISIVLSVFVLYAFGRSINIMSSFAYILALGIIVDDAIVVGEETKSQMARGHDTMLAAFYGAKRMLVPVLASSVTTVCAMLPLFAVSGTWGQFMLDIPLVIVSVIIASLIECFVILPGHLAHMRQAPLSRLRGLFNRVGEYALDFAFRPCIRAALRYRLTVMALVVAVLGLTVALIQTGHVPFEFYSGFESDRITASVEFKAQTPEQDKIRYMRQLEQSLLQRFASDKHQVVKSHVIKYNHLETQSFIDRLKNPYPDRFAAILVYLTERDMRSISNEAMLSSWQHALPKKPSFVESVDLVSGQSGPERSDLRFSLRGNQIEQVKRASLFLQDKLGAFQGVYNIQDDLPGQTLTYDFQLKPQVRSMGYTKAFFASQLQAMLVPKRLGYAFENNHTMLIDVGLDARDSSRWSTLFDLPLWLNKQRTVPLDMVLDLTPSQGFDAIVREQGMQAVEVRADVDLRQANARRIEAALWRDAVPQLKRNFSVDTKPSRVSVRQQNTLTEMQIGAVIGVLLMYLVLVYVFSSYVWPLAVLCALPLGLSGAVLGHWLLGLSLGLFSLFGMFTLSGIVVNGAIILLVRYRELKESAQDRAWQQKGQGGVKVKDALDEQKNTPLGWLEEACCQRVRPVFLTSLTTVVGLLPILLNQTATAAFFHTTAATIVFGMLFASFWILLVIPVLVSLLEDAKAFFSRGKR